MLGPRGAADQAARIERTAFGSGRNRGHERRFRFLRPRSQQRRLGNSIPQHPRCPAFGTQQQFQRLPAGVAAATVNTFIYTFS